MNLYEPDTDKRRRGMKRGRERIIEHHTISTLHAIKEAHRWKLEHIEDPEKAKRQPKRRPPRLKWQKQEWQHGDANSQPFINHDFRLVVSDEDLPPIALFAKHALRCWNRNNSNKVNYEKSYSPNDGGNSIFSEPLFFVELQISPK